MIDMRRIFPIAATAFILACNETPIEPPSELGGPSLTEVVVEPGDDLQAVIDGAPPGSTILLDEGVYDLTAGGVTIEKPLTFEGSDDAVIYGPEDGWTITVTGLETGTVTFHDLRFEGGARIIVATGNSPPSEVVVEDCVFVLGGYSVNAFGGTHLSVRNSLFKEAGIIGVFGAGEGVRVVAVDNTFEDMPAWGIQVQSEAYGHFEGNSLNNCAVSGGRCMAFMTAASGEAVDNEINNTRRGIETSRGDVVIRDNKITQFAQSGIRVWAAATVTGFDNVIEDALGGETDCAVVTDLPGTVQVVDNDIEDGGGIGIFVRAEQFNIDGTACVGP